MSTHLIAIAGFAALFVLMLLRVPVGIAMGMVGVVGFGVVTDNFGTAMRLLAQSPIRTIVDVQFAVIPLFILMGAFASGSGMSRELFRASHSLIGHFRGGLAIATIGACGGFAAVCGSSVATAATFGKIAYPEMRRYGYPDTISLGAVAAGGTLGILIPPSTVLAVYGVITEQDIGKLFVAGVIPGMLAALLYMLTITVLARLNPGALPGAARASWATRLTDLRKVWAVMLLFAFIIAGLYGGMFTATEAGGMGAGGALLIAVARRRLSLPDFLECLVSTVRTTAAIFTILIGAILFGYFLTVTQTPQNLTEWLLNLGLGRYGILLVIMLAYIVLGSLMDAMAMILLTLPVVFPIIQQLGFDPIWFGVIVVVVVELGMITPPVGMNVFVIKSVIPEARLATIFRGVAPFVLTDIVRLALLIAFPILVTFLPGRM